MSKKNIYLNGEKTSVLRAKLDTDLQCDVMNDPSIDKISEQQVSEERARRMIILNTIEGFAGKIRKLSNSKDLVVEVTFRSKIDESQYN